MDVQAGVFRLVDPPPGQADIIRAAVNAIDYPWWRLLRATWADPDGAILVKWLDTGQGTNGLFYGPTYEIHLSHMEKDLDSGAAFVFAHEVGHLVDRATFDTATRQAITTLYHSGDYIQIGHFDHDHPDAGHESEAWSSARNSYVSRLNECYADQFVAAFAPRIWNGDDAEGWRQRHPRFVHWTDDLAAIRRLTLERPMSVYDDVPPDHAYAESINRAAELGLMGGYSDGTFGPSDYLTRAQAATVMVRLYDRLIAEQSDA